MRAPYDPAKAHEYYVRTRHLTGRRKGSPTFTVTRAGGRKVKLTSKQLVEERAYVAQRVKSIKDNLSRLTVELSQLLQQARAKKAQTSQGPTAATKSKAAQQSKQYRQQHQQQLATKRKTASKKAPPPPPPTVDPVLEVEHKITEVKDRLHQVVARQRALASATKN